MSVGVTNVTGFRWTRRSLPRRVQDVQPLRSVQDVEERNRNPLKVRCVDLRFSAGVVRHPVKWATSGYHEIQQPPKEMAQKK